MHSPKRCEVCTLGPEEDENVVIERSYGSPTITKDGVTVAKEIDEILGPLREHAGRADGARSRQQNRATSLATADDHRDGPRAGHLPRRLEARRGGTQPDGDQARDRQGRGARRRISSKKMAKSTKDPKGR